MRLYNDQWNLITYLDLEIQDLKFNQIYKFCTKLDNLCNAKFNKIREFNLTFCHTQLKLFDRVFPKLRKQQDVIAQLVGKETSFRAKRSLFDIIGKTSKILFGTLDSDDASYYESQINKFSQNENQLYSLYKEQSHIVKTTIKNFNESINSVYSNEKLLKDNINKLKTYLTNNLKF